MFDLNLFLGIVKDEALARALERANPSLLALMTGGGDYLTERVHKGRCYLGKPLPLSPSLTQLESLEVHLLSLLRKLAPSYPFSEHPPVLITTIQ